MEKQFKPVPDCEELRYKGTPENPDIKIFVSHRIDQDSETIDNPLYIPVRCGAVYDERENVTMLGDDTGDNISEKRNSYCELTVQYWAWKNVKADYYGLCHYRRYLSFSKNQHYVKNQFQVVEDLSINQKTCEKYGLYFESAQRTLSVSNADIVLPELFDIGQINAIPGFTHLDRYYEELGKEFADSSIAKLEKVVEKYCPDYLSDLKEYFSQGKAYFCNCFLMKKDIFDEYSQWLFDILFQLEPQIDYTHLSMKKSRILGFFSEDLFSIYFMKNIKKKKWKKKEQELVFLITQLNFRY